MANTLRHSPATIIQQLLIDLGLGTEPVEQGDSNDWPVYATSEPNEPDDDLVVYDTTGKDQGSSMPIGELEGFDGFQIRIRATDHNTGWAKADEIRRTLAQDVYLKVVHCTVPTPAASYLIYAISDIGRILALGKDTPGSKRSLFTVNAIAAISAV